jgi:ubiquinone/menaquinone biosynthesis C-methylase UbiE
MHRTHKTIERTAANHSVFPSPEAPPSFDTEALELGSVLKRFLNPRSHVDNEERSSIRHDIALHELSCLLALHDSPIRVIDICCGKSPLANLLLRFFMPAQLSRIEYLALDRDTQCIEAVRSRYAATHILRRFEALQREVCDLQGIPGFGEGSVDLIVLCNALHEIPPRHYPTMFESLDRLLNRERGSICLVDMEELPEDSPEANAITWQCSDVKEFLEAGNFSCISSLHPKSVVVYQMHVRPAHSALDKHAMSHVMTEQLEKKYNRALLRWKEVKSCPTNSADVFFASVNLARIAEDLDEVRPCLNT